MIFCKCDGAGAGLIPRPAGRRRTGGTGRTEDTASAGTSPQLEADLISSAEELLLCCKYVVQDGCWTDIRWILHCHGILDCHGMDPALSLGPGQAWDGSCTAMGSWTAKQWILHCHRILDCHGMDPALPSNPGLPWDGSCTATGSWTAMGWILHCHRILDSHGMDPALPSNPGQPWDGSCTAIESWTALGWILHCHRILDSHGMDPALPSNPGQPWDGSCTAIESWTAMGWILHCHRILDSLGMDPALPSNPGQPWDGSCTAIESWTALGWILHCHRILDSHLQRRDLEGAQYLHWEKALPGDERECFKTKTISQQMTAFAARDFRKFSRRKIARYPSVNRKTFIADNLAFVSNQLSQQSLQCVYNSLLVTPQLEGMGRKKPSPDTKDLPRLSFPLCHPVLLFRAVKKLLAIRTGSTLLVSHRKLGLLAPQVCSCR
ncbi:hypothetical protein Q9966_001191 [Columba livia]|nr:hypothetical protein Q9966_001191 [Columba livia]